jgi:hypothetical protein
VMMYALLRSSDRLTCRFTNHCNLRIPVCSVKDSET